MPKLFSCYHRSLKVSKLRYLNIPLLYRHNCSITFSLSFPGGTITENPHSMSFSIAIFWVERLPFFLFFTRASRYSPSFLFCQKIINCRSLAPLQTATAVKSFCLFYICIVPSAPHLFADKLHCLTSRNSPVLFLFASNPCFSVLIKSKPK